MPHAGTSVKSQSKFPGIFFLIFEFLISAILYQVIHRYRQQDTHVSISFALALSMFV